MPQTGRVSMPLCPVCRSGDDVVWYAHDDGQGATFRCRADDHKFRAISPVAVAAVRARVLAGEWCEKEAERETSPWPDDAAGAGRVLTRRPASAPPPTQRDAGAFSIAREGLGPKDVGAPVISHDAGGEITRTLRDETRHIEDLDDVDLAELADKGPSTAEEAPLHPQNAGDHHHKKKKGHK
jgi:hypothetical protein